MHAMIPANAGIQGSDSAMSALSDPCMTQGQTSRQTDSAHAHSKHHYLRSTYSSRQTDRQTVTYPDKFTEGRQAGTQTAT